MIKNGKLFIIRELNYTTKEDAFYYVLHLLQQQEARRDETELVITGDAPEFKGIVQLMKRHLPHVRNVDKGVSVTDVKGQKESAVAYIQLIGIQ